MKNNYYTKSYLEKYVYLICMIIVLLGGVNYGIIGIFNYDIISKSTKYLGLSILKRFIYVLIAIVSIYLFFKKYIFLPFLGETVYPCNNLKDKIPSNATLSINIDVPPLSKIVYWAAEPGNEYLKIAPDPWSAYGNYENSGIATSDINGKAILKIRPPVSYKVGMLVSQTLKQHVHYRYCSEPGMLSEVHTVFI